MAFNEDFAPFLAEFGTDAVLDGQPVRGIFDNAFDVAGLGARGMATTGPQLVLRTGDVPAQPHGLPLVLASGGSFTVLEHQPDGTGMSILVLERA